MTEYEIRGWRVWEGLGHVGLVGSSIGFCFLLWKMGSHCHVGIKKEVVVNGTINT